MKKTLVIGLLAALSLGLLTACGGGGSSAKEVEILLGENGEYVYNPKTLSFKNGDTIKLKMVNKDATTAHSVVIPDFNFNSGQVPANTTQTKEFKVNKTGKIEFHCDVPGHKEGGMVGSIDAQ